MITMWKYKNTCNTLPISGSCSVWPASGYGHWSMSWQTKKKEKNTVVSSYNNKIIPPSRTLNSINIAMISDHLIHNEGWDHKDFSWQLEKIIPNHGRGFHLGAGSRQWKLMKSAVFYCPFTLSVCHFFILQVIKSINLQPDQGRLKQQ